MKIARIPIVSSQIASLGYDAPSQTLDIQFKPRKGKTEGDVYRYQNFTQEDMNAFLAADSRGSHFIRVIKPNPDRWPYRKLSAEEAS